jgi:hypothetical protein
MFVTSPDVLQGNLGNSTRFSKTSRLFQGDGKHLKAKRLEKERTNLVGNSSGWILLQGV